MFRTRERIDPSQLDLKDTVVSINRVTKVVKGGKNLSFSALVVVGDGHGVVGFGVGKAQHHRVFAAVMDHPPVLRDAAEVQDADAGAAILQHMPADRGGLRQSG